MEIDNVSLNFNAHELESIHYVLQVGVAHLRCNKKSKDKSTSRIANKTSDWQDTAENIRKQLPLKWNIGDGR